MNKNTPNPLDNEPPEGSRETVERQRDRKNPEVKVGSELPGEVRREGTDYRDERRGAYDPVSKDGLPQPCQVKDETNPHEKAQWGADVRADPLPGSEPVLPEGLVRSPRGPLNRRTGRRKTE